MSEPDWVDDPSLSRKEILDRFEALGPEETHGPHHVVKTWSGATTTTYVDGVRQD
jgi:hypothetical protein